MSDPRDYKLDISSAGSADDGSSRRTAVNGLAAETPAPSRPYLSVHFACCGVYQRVYRSADGTTYQGRCPRCTMPVRFVVGEGGTSERTFVVR